jgi:hypothetical protein
MIEKPRDLQIHDLDELDIVDRLNTVPYWARWVCVTPHNNWIYCVDVGHACAIQRSWRAEFGMDLMTGEPIGGYRDDG